MNQLRNLLDDLTVTRTPSLSVTLNLAANVAQTVAVPQRPQAYYALFSSTADFIVAYNRGPGPVAAVIPPSGSQIIGDVTVPTFPQELSPVARHIDCEQSMSLISNQPCIVTIAFYGK